MGVPTVPAAVWTGAVETRPLALCRRLLTDTAVVAGAAWAPWLGGRGPGHAGLPRAERPGVVSEPRAGEVGPCHAPAMAGGSCSSRVLGARSPLTRARGRWPAAGSRAQTPRRRSRECDFPGPQEADPAWRALRTPPRSGPAPRPRAGGWQRPLLIWTASGWQPASRAACLCTGRISCELLTAPPPRGWTRDPVSHPPPRLTESRCPDVNAFPKPADDQSHLADTWGLGRPAGSTRA